MSQCFLIMRLGVIFPRLLCLRIPVVLLIHLKLYPQSVYFILHTSVLGEISGLEQSLQIVGLTGGSEAAKRTLRSVVGLNADPAMCMWLAFGYGSDSDCARKVAVDIGVEAFAVAGQFAVGLIVSF